tara:strand:+ start:1463 stop:2503 length:1041 start_codon:yes stop_codon:yes gene_type:complete
MKKTVANIIILVLSVLALDIYLSAVGAVSLSEYEFNPKTGIRFRNFDNQIIFNEGFAIKSYNSKELYNDDNSTKKSFRIALVGDSYVKSDQVFERHHFGQIMKNNLAIETPIEVLNYGYNGSDLKQMYITQKVIVDPTNPDLILYFLSNQDLQVNSFNDPLLPQISDSGNKLEIVCDFPEQISKSYQVTNTIKQHSSIVNLALNSIKQYKTNGILPALLGKFYYQPSLSEKDQLHKDSGHSKTPSTEVSHLMEKIIQDIDESKVIFVNRDKAKLSNDILALIKANNIPLIDLSPALGDSINNQSNYYYWKVSDQTGHWNKKAHQEIGTYLASELNKILSTTKPKLH